MAERETIDTAWRKLLPEYHELPYGHFLALPTLRWDHPESIARARARREVESWFRYQLKTYTFYYAVPLGDLLRDRWFAMERARMERETKRRELIEQRTRIVQALRHRLRQPELLRNWHPSGAVTPLFQPTKLH
jgi:hypothetical protein